jgi:ParB family chromosome partitioning protein
VIRSAIAAGSCADNSDSRRLAFYPTGDGEHRLLPLDCIRPSSLNPRRDFNDRALEELAESIRKWGQLQPVLVRRDAEPGYFVLICGERRWRAHQRAGLRTIWAVERDAVDADSLRLGLIENLQRVGLSRVEKLAALDQLAELAQSAGLRRTAVDLHIDPSWLSRQISMRRDAVIFPALESGRLGFGQAAELLRAPQAKRRELLERVLEASARVSSATIRAWVEAARSDARHVGREAAPDAPVDKMDTVSEPTTRSYRALLTDLERLGAPSSYEERAALLELVEHAEQLLRGEPIQHQSESSPTSWTELYCLMCGERGATVSNGTVHAQYGGAVRQRGKQLICGRCGGALTPGERGIAYTCQAPNTTRAR